MIGMKREGEEGGKMGAEGFSGRVKGRGNVEGKGGGGGEGRERMMGKRKRGGEGGEKRG
jgi:hypothetical protein